MRTSIKLILALVFLIGVFLQNGNAETKTSTGTGNWNTAATWSPSGVPLAGDAVIIQTGHNVTLNTSSASLLSLTINTGGTLTSTGAYTFNATTIAVNGLYYNGSTGTITGTMTVNSGGTYQHAINGGTIKTATWNAGSTCNISGVTSTLPSGFSQSFSNLTWSSTNTSAISIAPTAINGDFNITTGGGTDKTLRINTTPFTIGGNLNLSGSANLQISSSTQRTLTVNGDFSMTSGKLDFGTSTKIGTLNIKGDYSHTGGTITESGSSSGAIVFNGSTTQTFTSGGTVSGLINYTVNSGTTLQMADASTVINGNTFTLSSGATLGIKSTSGITTAGNASGNIQTTTRTFSTTANYMYNGSSAQVTGNALSTAANLTINNSAGVTASSDITVNGVLYLQSANPFATKGALEMVTDYGNYPLDTTTITSYILTMGSSATTVGIGDVTGKVRRTSIVSGASNSFGNEKTTITFTALSNPTGTMPSAITVTIMIGSEIGGKTTAVKRSYEVIPTMPGGANTNSVVAANLHYLDGELLSNTESKLVTWDCDIEGGGYVRSDEHGRASYDITTSNYKYIGVSNVPASYFIQSWRTIFFIADYVSGPKTWTGVTSSDWNTSTNWEPTGVPSEGSRVVIPSTTNKPILAGATTVQSVSIELGATLTLNANLTLKGSGIPGSGAFLNVLGTLYPNTYKITFQDLGGVISGTVDLYDVEISSGASLTNESGSLMRIGGTVTKSGLWYADVKRNTIEYNGSSSQNIVTTDGNDSYSGLKLSGSGTKTLPTMSISGDFTNNGNFTATGTTLTMNLFYPQTINGSGSSVFNNLVINNLNSTTLGANITVSGDLTVNSICLFNLGTYSCNRNTNGGTMTIAGTLKLGGNSGGQTGSNFPSNFATMVMTGGTVEYNGSTQTVFKTNGLTYNNLIVNSSGTVNIPADISTTNLEVKGSGSVTIPSTISTLTNLTLNNANGLTLAGNLTVNGILNLYNGILSLGAYNLTLGSSASITGDPGITNLVNATSTGELRKVFAGTGAFTFPIGGGVSDYSPVTLNFTSGSFASAYVGVNLSKQKHPNNTSSTSYLNRYWSISQSGITNFSCDVTLQYLNSDVIGNEVDIWCGKYSSGAWTLLSVANLDANQLSGTVTSFSTFTGGEQGVLPVVLSNLSSSVSGRDIKLSWITSFENNNSGFEIERVMVTNENLVFEKVGFVSGKGTVNIPTNYTYKDRNLQTGKYKYRLKQIDHNGNSAYYSMDSEIEVGVPTKYDLSQNYPNPFNPKTKINFEIPYDSKVKMLLYDVTGREIKTLINEVRNAGYHTIVFDASDISSGIYFYRFIANANGKDYINTKKMAIIK